MRPDGNCRACMVEIKGERVLAPSCCRTPDAGHGGARATARAPCTSQKMVVELLLSDMPGARLQARLRARRTGPRGSASASRASRRARSRRADLSHPAMAVNLDACIQCTRCVRACREEQVNDVIGYAFRGAHSKIVFDLDDPMGESTCVACGECVQACPTGALAPAQRRVPRAGRQAGRVGVPVLRRRLPAHLPRQGQHDRPRRGPRRPREPRAPVREGPLRLRLRAPSAAPDEAADPQAPACRSPPTSRWTPRIRSSVFREATWEEALALAGGTLRADPRHARAAARSPASARPRARNEEAYLFQKLVRTGFGTNNVDHCTRLCHASSVAALLEGIGSGAVSNPVMDVMKAEVVLLIGANPVVNHPVAATWIKNAVKRGTQADPRRPAPLRARAARDALPAVQAGHRRRAAERDDAHDRRGGARRRGVHRRPHERLRGAAARTSPGYSPEAMAPLCGIPARDDPRGRAAVRDVAAAR